MKRFSGVKWGVVERIVWAWILTLPATALIGFWRALLALFRESAQLGYAVGADANAIDALRQKLGDEAFHQAMQLMSTPPPRMSEEIAALLAALPEHRVTLREVLATLKGRAYTLLLLILALPFCQPIPMPGLSTFFGAIIALIGLRLSLRLEPWIPARMLERPLSTRLLVRALTAAGRLVRMLEVVLRPRWSFLVEWTLLHHLYGAMICVSGLFLLLPLPVPLSNVLPALAIVLLAAAMLERDGLFGILGFITFAITLVVFGGIFIGSAAAIEALREWFAGNPPSD